MSALLIVPSGCLDTDTSDQANNDSLSENPDDSSSNLLDPTVDDGISVNPTADATTDSTSTEESSVQTVTSYYSSGGSSSSSSSSSTSPDVSRTITSADYTEPVATITGDLTITGATTGTITLPSGLVINGDLTVNTPSATVTNRANVGGTINIIAVSVNTWNQYGNAGNIQMGAQNATFNLFSGNISSGITLTKPSKLVINTSSNLPNVTVAVSAEGSDIDNHVEGQLNLTAQSNITFAGNITITPDVGVTVTERVSTPTATPVAGTYIGTQNVVLSTVTDSATIYYTTDGSAPTSSSPVYGGAIEVAVNKTIKAFAVKAGLDNSTIAQFAYVIEVPITSIAVTGYGDVTELVNSTTLQMNATVLPVDATDSSVTWSVQDGTGTATINSTGMLTAVAEGTVTVKATANDGSAVEGTLVVTITPVIVSIADFANTANTDTTATFTWTAASGATSVKIQQSLTGANTWSDSTTAAIATDATTATVTGLAAVTGYDFKLVVTGGTNAGDSNVVEGVTTA